MIFPKKTYISLLTAATVAKAFGYSVGDDWSTLTPTDGYLTGATTEFTQSFGIAINPVVSSVPLTSVTKTFDSPVITQIGDGQIQATTETSVGSIPVITQIGDGQIQATTETSVGNKPVITQISDGQIQASAPTDDSTTIYTVFSTTLEKKYVTVVYTGEPESSFISTTSSLSSSISTTSSQSSFSQDITTTYTITPTTLVVVTLTSPTLPIIATTSAHLMKRGLPQSCLSAEALAMTLSDGVLKDSKGRVGSIVANRQFQFDGPPPQAGAIYAAGWSILDGKLALGKRTIFYQCLSGSFYNLYDESIGEQCVAVELDVIELVNC